MRLVVAGHDAALDEVDDAAGDQLGLHAEVVLVVEVQAERGRHRADAHLHGVAVVDQLGGDERADDLDGGDLLVAPRRGRQRPGRRVRLDDDVEPVEVDVVLAAGADEVLVHLGDDEVGVARTACPTARRPGRSCSSRGGRAARPARGRRRGREVKPSGTVSVFQSPIGRYSTVAGVHGGAVERRGVVVVQLDRRQHVRLAPRRQRGRVVDADVAQVAGPGAGRSARRTACAACTCTGRRRRCRPDGSAAPLPRRRQLATTLVAPVPHHRAPIAAELPERGECRTASIHRQRLRMVPMPSIHDSSVRPVAITAAACAPWSTPTGVPVAMMSPGRTGARRRRSSGRDRKAPPDAMATSAIS